MFHNKELLEHPELIKSMPIEIRLARARDPESPENLLWILSKDDFWFVRDFVASNMSTPKECLLILQNDPDFRVQNEALKTLSMHSLSLRSTKDADTVLDSSTKGVLNMSTCFESNIREYARYFCGNLDSVVSYKEREQVKEREKDGFISDTVEYEPIFDGKVYPTLSESTAAQIDAFGWQYDDDRRKTSPGGPHPMSPEKLRRILQNAQTLPYSPPNFYYAFKKPDDTLLMIATKSSQMKHILVYEYNSFFKDYGAFFYSIDQNATHIENNVKYDPIDKLVNKVADCTYLGEWHDPDLLMDDNYGLGRVLACGRWKLAQEKILGPEKIFDFGLSLDDKIKSARNISIKQPFDHDDISQDFEHDFPF